LVPEPQVLPWVTRPPVLQRQEPVLPQARRVPRPGLSLMVPLA